jgi:hypothetical protein
MDILDEATDDINAFLASLDSGVTVVTPTIEDPAKLEDVDGLAHSLWDTDPDVEDIHPDYLQAVMDLQDVAFEDIRVYRGN